MTKYINNYRYDDKCIDNNLEISISNVLNDQDDAINTNKIHFNWSQIIVDKMICDAHVTAYVGHPFDKYFAVLKFIVSRDIDSRDIVSKRAHLLGAFQTYTELYLDSLLDTLKYDISEVYQVDKMSNNQIELSFIVNPYEYVTGARKNFMICYNIFMSDVIKLMKEGKAVNVPDEITNLIGKSITAVGENGVNLLMNREKLIEKASIMLDDIWGDD